MVGYGKGLVGMRKIFLMAVLSVVCCDVWGVYSGAYKSYGVAAGTEQVLTADMNFDTNMVVLAAGSTLRLSDATLKAFLKVDGGEATLVAPAGVDEIVLEGGLREVNDGALKIDGAVQATLGRTQKPYPHSFWPLLEATNISFTATEGVRGLLLSECLAVKDLPTDTGCPVTVASGAWLGFMTRAALQKVTGADEEELASFHLRNWNLMCMYDAVFPSNSMVTVHGGAEFAFKPCSLVGDNAWAGVAATATAEIKEGTTRWEPFSNITNLVLASDANARAVARSFSVREFDFCGEISGDGDVIVKANMLNNERNNFRGDLTFRGSFSVEGAWDGVVVYSSSPGARENVVNLTGSGARLQVRGQVPTATDRAYIHELHATSLDQTVYVNGAPTLEFGKVFGSVKFTGKSDVVAVTARVDRAASGAVLGITPTAVLALTAADEGVQIKSVDYGDGRELVLDLRAFTGERIPPVEIAQGFHLTVLGGEGKTLQVSGAGSVTASACDRIVSSSQSFGVNVPEGASTVVETMAPTNWRAKVAQWYDASERGTLGGYPTNPDGSAVLYTNGYPVVNIWGDKRTGTNGVHLYNGRSLDATGDFGDRHDEVNPFVVTNGLNGLDYVSCGSYQTKIPNQYQRTGLSGGTVTEARRLLMASAAHAPNLTNPDAWLSCAYAILVFGSAQGGGAAILGGADFKRTPGLGNPFFESGDWPMFVDGVATNGATARPNGGWQILSVNLQKKVVNALGGWTGYDKSGGQDYAEVLLFSSAPTDLERRDCERYLAKKWGLESSYVDAGTPAALVRTNGKGELVLAGDAELAGGFHGTVRVAPDATLVVSALPPPPGEEVVPSANRVEWFDPDAEGALYCPDASTRPLCVSALYPRTESGVVSGGHAMCGLSGSTDRRPWKNAVARGDGPVRTWLDFDNTYNEGSGNTLRHKNAYNNGTDSTPIGDVREVFMVLDTSRGGGTPLGTAVGCEYTARDGSGKDISKPIWPVVDRSPYNSVTTRLDNVLLDGGKKGFNGRPEVLACTFGTAWQPAFFGYYAHGDTTKGNAEIIGESIFYSTPLSAPDRAKVTAYLAYKWFGKVMTDYSDLSRMTVDGAGRVEVADLAAAPKFADSFTGTLVSREKTCAFTLDPAASRTAATDAVAVAAALELPKGTVVTVACTGALKPGTYALLATRGLSFANDSNPELVFTGENPMGYKMQLTVVDGTLALHVQSLGTQVIFR